MTCEGVLGMECNAWSDDGGNPPDHEAHVLHAQVGDVVTSMPGPGE